MIGYHKYGISESAPTVKEDMMLNETTAGLVIYTPVKVNSIDGWAMLVNGATIMFISEDFVNANGLEVQEIR